MAKPVENDEKSDSFDLDRIRKLLQLMEKFDVSEINLQNDDESWKIRRGPRIAYSQPASSPGFVMPMAEKVASSLLSCAFMTNVIVVPSTFK